MNTGQTTAVNVRGGVDVKNQATVLARYLGVAITTLTNRLADFFEHLREVNIFSGKEIPNKNTLKELEQSKKDVENGNVISFYKTEDAISYLNNIISARSS